MSNQTLPYLDHPSRLADIMAAIQVLGANRYDKRALGHWEEDLKSPQSADNWRIIFERHSEFFGIEGEYVSLRWRRTLLKSDPDTGKEYTYDEFKAEKARLNKEDSTGEKARAFEDHLSRKALSEEQIATLLNAAIELQDRAKAWEERRRWWVDPTIAIIGVVAGFLVAIVGMLI